MRVAYAIPIALTVILGPARALAFSQSDVTNCSQIAEPDRQIEGCTRLLNSGKLPNPLRAIAYSNRGNALCSKGEFDLAIRDDDEAIRLAPKLASAFANRSSAWSNKGEYDRAIEDASMAVSLAPKVAINFILRASAWNNKGDSNHALSDANEAIKLLPNSGAGYVLRGNIWRQKGDLKHALADQSMAIELGKKESDNKPIYYVQRGDTLRYKGDLDLAFADYDQALRLAPGFIAALVGQGLTYEKRGDLGHARLFFQKAIESHDIVRSGISNEALKTAHARIAAFDSGVAQPFIPPAPSTVESATSVPTSALVVQTVAPMTSVRELRIALVIGNSSYKNVAFLRNPQHDAKAIENSLRAIGFNVTLLTDATRAELSEALGKFANQSEKADWALVYYAGHGMEVNGTNYLIPVDARLATDRDIQVEAVPLNEVVASVSGAKRVALILLDACRENPFSPAIQNSATPEIARRTGSIKGEIVETRGFKRYLGEEKVPGSMLLVYSARQGQVALDGEGLNSPFAIAVAQRLATPGVEINKIFRLVRDDVMEATAGRQEPYSYGSLPGSEDFFFVAKE